MRTHTTQEFPQTRKTPAHNPIIISRNTEKNVSEIIRTLVAPNTTIIYIMPRYEQFGELYKEFQKQIGEAPYMVSMANKTIRIPNDSVLRFYRADHTTHSKLHGIKIDKAYIDGHISLPSSQYKELMQNIASRIR